jgi:hypothetical protein
MLKDKLEKLSVRQKNEKLCALGIEMSKMSSDDLDSFVKAMHSDASSNEIMMVLQEEGMANFGITHFRDKRRICFSESSPCFCIRNASNQEGDK